MSSSLSELLAQESFKRRQKSLKQPIAIPLFICRANNNHISSSARLASVSNRSNSKSSEFSRPTNDNDNDDNYIDEVTKRAVVAILSGYIGRYAKDEAFREKIRGKCLSCLEEEEDEAVEKLEAVMESVDMLVGKSLSVGKEEKLKLVRHIVQVLSIVVASLRNESRPRVSACAHLYLAIVYKHEREQRRSARHLLQAFCDEPFMARTHLMADLWEHFFLPHLLHLKVWYAKECEWISGLEIHERDRKMMALFKAYNEQVDLGTVEFALYYKKLLKERNGTGMGMERTRTGTPVPVVPLPERPYRVSRRSMDTCGSSNSSVNNL